MQEQHIKITDFGIAKKLAQGQTTYQPSTISGTLQWMSPEQITGKALCLRSDIFSLGTVLWELLSETVPFSDIQDPLEADPRKLRDALNARDFSAGGWPFGTASRGGGGVKLSKTLMLPADHFLSQLPTELREMCTSLLILLHQHEPIFRPSSDEACCILAFLEQHLNQEQQKVPKVVDNDPCATEILQCLQQRTGLAEQVALFYKKHDNRQLSQLDTKRWNSILNDRAKWIREVKTRYNLDVSLSPSREYVRDTRQEDGAVGGEEETGNCGQSGEAEVVRRMQRQQTRSAIETTEGTEQAQETVVVAKEEAERRKRAEESKRADEERRREQEREEAARKRHEEEERRQEEERRKRAEESKRADEERRREQEREEKEQDVSNATRVPEQIIEVVAKEEKKAQEERSAARVPEQRSQGRRDDADVDDERAQQECQSNDGLVWEGEVWEQAGVSEMVCRSAEGDSSQHLAPTHFKDAVSRNACHAHRKHNYAFSHACDSNPHEGLVCPCTCAHAGATSAPRTRNRPQNADFRSTQGAAPASLPSDSAPLDPPRA